MRNKRFSAVLLLSALLFGVLSVSGITQFTTYASQDGFVSVTNITGVPTTATVGTPLALTGTVEPWNATNQNIQWSVRDAGATGATINGNILNTTAEGTAVVTATIMHGELALGPDASFTEVSAGAGFTMALRSDGSLWAWGSNQFGQLGLNDTTDRNEPTRVGDRYDWVAVSAGYHHTMALRSDGSLWAWGWNASGQLGLRDTAPRNEPTRVGNDNDWVAVSAGTAYTIALRSNGRLYTWGLNNRGQLGLGSNTDRNEPTRVGNLNNWVSVSAGDGHTMALRSDGNLYAWGANSAGQLGLGNTTNRNTPVRVGDLNDWVSVSAGINHTMALRSDGSLYAWGAGGAGQLGLGDWTLRITPARVGNLNDWVSVSAGDQYTMALRSDGSLWIWGINGDGYPWPAQVEDINDWVSVSAGWGHTMALRSDGSIWAWGTNWFGQLGLGDTINRNEPVRLSGVWAAYWVSISSGGGHTMALRSDGSLWAWGRNNWGQLGLGNTTDRNVPTRVGNLNDWVSVSAGSNHTMALRSDGSLWAWGQNNWGQLGLGNNYTNRNEPARVGNFNNWVSVSAGADHTMALRSDGSLWAWGFNYYGQLGLWNTTDPNEPVRVGDRYDWVAVSAGFYHTMALRSDGSLWAWGLNEVGQLGIGDTTNRNEPVRVGDRYDWVAVSTGAEYTMALRSDGSLWAWGTNNNGTLGIGDIPGTVSEPALVGDRNDWVSVSAGYYHTMALRSDGSLWAWGTNLEGQLGLGNTTFRNVPVRVGNLNDWVSVSAGALHTIALRSNGSLWVWGWNASGQLGLGDWTAQRNTPARHGSPYTQYFTITVNPAPVWGISLTPSGNKFFDAAELGYGQLPAHNVTVSNIGNQQTGSLSVALSGANTDSFALSTTVINSIAVGGTGIFTVVPKTGLNAGTYTATVTVSGGANITARSVNVSFTVTTPFVPVTEITGVPTETVAGTPLELTGTVEPWNATHQGIVWSVRNAGTTGATINGNILNTTSAGTVDVTATISDGSHVKAISAGSSHTIALKEDGSLWAWGSDAWASYNNTGQLGIGANLDNCIYRQTLPNYWYCTEPVRVGTDNYWSAISAGSGHSRALKTDYSLWAWGINEGGQLGDGTWTNRNIPVQEYTKATDWMAVSAGYYHTIALKEDGSLWAWGNNGSGQLGDGMNTSSNIPVQEYTKATDWVAVSTGDNHTIALKEDGTLWAWGRNNYSQLGDGTNTDSNIPVQEYIKATDWVAVSAGSSHTIALKEDGSLWAWGNNGSGQLGDSTNTSSNIPVQEYTKATDWVAVSVGGNHTIALKEDGTLWAWGRNNYSQLGDGTWINRNIPVQEYTKATDWVAVSAGVDHTMALRSDGSLWAWGDNYYGQLGDGTNIQRNTPVEVMSPDYAQDFVITVIPIVTLESIAVTNLPFKTVYTKGDALDLTGMIATAMYDDGSEALMTNYTTVPHDGVILNTIGEQIITVFYEGKDDSFTVTVNPEPVNSFERLQTAIANYAAATKDVVIPVTGGFDIKEPLVISAPQTTGATLTIRSADAENPVTLSRGFIGDMFAVNSGATLILENIIIDGGSNGAYGLLNDGGGSLVNVQTGGMLIMNSGAVLRNNCILSQGGGVQVAQEGIFTMTGGEISGNTVWDSYGGGVFVGDSATFTMTGGEITGNWASSGGGGVFVSDSASFNLSGTAVITDNSALNNGGGVYISTDGVFEMTGGEISSNSALTGGGVFVGDSATFTMTGGEITGNSAFASGGVLVQGGTFNLDGMAVISRNTAVVTLGGGVYISSDGVFNMAGGEINGNTANGGGGGVLLSNGAAFTMTGGEITGNEAHVFEYATGFSYSYGGGVWVGTRATFTMHGGEIRGNYSALLSGGVHVDENATFTMTGGAIINNTAERSGGGVYAMAMAGTFNLGGVAVINGNVPNNVSLGTNRYIMLGTGKGPGGNGVVKPVFGEMYVGVTKSVNNGIFVLDANPGDEAFFFADESDKKVVYDSGQLRIVDVEKTFIDYIAEYASTTANMVIPINDNMTLYETMSIPANAHGASLTITSENADNPVTLTRGFLGAMFTVNNGATLILEDIIIDGGRNEEYADNGGGSLVHVQTGGALIMNSGAVLRNNTTGSSGGGVYVAQNGIFTMKDGEITGNTAVIGGGVHVDTFGAFMMNDGEISNNTAGQFGGGVYVAQNGIFTMTGGIISNNTAEQYGGGVHVHYGGVFDMTDGLITGNNANLMSGGGVMIWNYGAFTMTGGEISNNTAEQYGGGVHVSWNSEFTMTDGSITGNNANFSGGGVYVNSGGAFIMTGGENAGNYATWNGGGVYVGGGEIIFGGSTVIGGNFSGDSLNNVSLMADAYIKLGTGVDAPAPGIDIGVTKTADNAIIVLNANTVDETFFFADEPGKKVVYENSVLRIVDDPTFCIGPICAPDDSIYIEIPHDMTLESPVTVPSGRTITIKSVGAATPVILTRDVVGDLFRVNNGATLILENIIIDGDNLGVYGDNSGGSLVMVQTGGSFTMNSGAVLRNNTNDSSGGGVYVAQNGIFTMTGGEISGNSAAWSGGGVFVNDGTFIMTDGEITRNSSSNRGGGMGCTNGSTFTMNGGGITDNKASVSGGGVYISFRCAFAMLGGEITGNNAVSGGGVAVVDDGTFTMLDGEITGNNASMGGGVVVGIDGIFTMTDGEISGNNSAWGGGVFSMSHGVITMIGGEITGNEASVSGGGVFVSDNGGDLILGGTAIINGNTKAGADNNIYLDNGRYVTFSTTTPPVAGGINVGVTKTSDDGVIALDVNPGDAAFFFADESDKKVVFESGQLRIIVDTGGAPVFEVNGEYYSSIDEMLESIPNNTPTIINVLDNIGALLEIAGKKIITFDLNGFDLPGGIQATSGSYVTLIGSVSGEVASYGYGTEVNIGGDANSGVTASEGGTVNVYGDVHNGVFASEGGKVNIEGDVFDSHVEALGDETVIIIEGDVFGEDYGSVVAGNNGSVIIRGNVYGTVIQSPVGALTFASSDSGNGFGGVIVYNGGTVRIEGKLHIEDENQYVMVDDQWLGKHEGVSSIVKLGYIEYTIAGASVVWVKAPALIIYGDANGDGEVDLSDVLRLRRCLAGHPVVCSMPESDANGDGEVDLSDVLRLRRYLADHPVILGPPQTQQLGFEMFVSSASLLPANEVKVSVSQETAAPGDFFDVEISLDENPGLLALQLRLGYNAEVLEAVDITSGSFLSIPVMPLLSANPMSLNFEGVTLDDIFGTGILATIRFRVLDNAAAGSTAISIKGIYAGNAIEDSFAVTTIDGSVLVEPPQMEHSLISVVPTASMKVLNGNKNDLTITVTETYSDESITILTETFSINNNAAGSYLVGRYVVYVDTKGNDQIRQCYIVK